MIPKEEWLPQAKRLVVGNSIRVRHRREGRPNLVIGHDAEKYWCYCHACHEGGVVHKEHVRLEDGRTPEKHRSDLTLPQDMRPVIGEPALENAIGAFLAGKGMDFKYLPNLTGLTYSASRKRLILNTSPGHYLGRDVSGQAKEKWLSYNNEKYLSGYMPEVHKLAVVVEDPFSFYKVQHAFSTAQALRVFCSLGTRMGKELMLVLTQSPLVMFMYDGDKAGYAGSESNAKRLSVFGPRCIAHCAPPGFDPKDMELSAIKEHIYGGVS